jgi:hypothetical protein
MFEPPEDTFCEIVEYELKDIDTAHWADDINLCRKFVYDWCTALGTPCDIGWAETLALELLITFLFESHPLYNETSFTRAFKGAWKRNVGGAHH